MTPLVVPAAVMMMVSSPEPGFAIAMGGGVVIGVVDGFGQAAAGVNLDRR